MEKGYKMFQFLKLFLINAVIFLILDSLWLSFANKKFYQPYIGHLMGQTKLLPAIIFYLIYVAALVFFVLAPGQVKESLSYVLLAGAFLEQYVTLAERRIVFIVDECHRSTFGDMLQNIRRSFPNALFFRIHRYANSGRKPEEEFHHYTRCVLYLYTRIPGR